MNIFGVIHVRVILCPHPVFGAHCEIFGLRIQRYLTLKAMTPAERKKVNPKVVFFAGKAAPGCAYRVPYPYTARPRR